MTVRYLGMNSHTGLSISEAARAVMLAYAAGADLDQLGANSSVERLVITPSDETSLPPTPALMESDTDYRLRIQQRR